MVHVHCPGCKASLRVPVGGGRLKCPHCKARLDAPSWPAARAWLRRPRWVMPEVVRVEAVSVLCGLASVALLYALHVGVLLPVGRAHPATIRVEVAVPEMIDAENPNFVATAPEPKLVPFNAVLLWGGAGCCAALMALNWYLIWRWKR